MSITTKILIVDDEERIRKLLNLYLVKEGYITEEVADGKAALKLILMEDFDLVLLDIMLPGVDGIEIIKEVRKTNETPIIMISARGEEIHRGEGFQAGADDYIVKPFSPREVMLRVSALLKRTKVYSSEPEVITF